MIRAFKISSSNQYTSPKIATESCQSPTTHDALRLPLVESRFAGWLTVQPYVHDSDVLLGRDRFRVFFQRHRYLPWNPVLKVHGDIVIMRVGKKNIQNVVNPRSGDKKRVQLIARRWATAPCDLPLPDYFQIIDLPHTYHISKNVEDDDLNRCFSCRVECCWLHIMTYNTYIN